MSLNQFNTRLMTLISNANAIKKNKTSVPQKEPQNVRPQDNSLSHRSQQPSYPSSVHQLYQLQSSYLISQKSPPKNRSSSGTQSNLVSNNSLATQIQNHQQYQIPIANLQENDAQNKSTNPNGFQTGQKYLPLGHENKIVHQQHTKSDFSEEMKKILAGSQPVLQNKQMNQNNNSQLQQSLQQSASASLLLSSSSSSKLHTQAQHNQQQNHQQMNLAQQQQQQLQNTKKKGNHGYSLSEVSENLYVLDGVAAYGNKQAQKNNSQNSYGSYNDVKSNNNTSNSNINKSKVSASKSSQNLSGTDEIQAFKKTVQDLRLPKLSAAAAAAVAAQQRAANSSTDLRSSSTQPMRETPISQRAQDTPSTYRAQTETSGISNNDNSHRKVLTENDDSQIADKHFLFTKPTPSQLTSTSLLRELKAKKATQSAMYKQMASSKYSNHFRADSSGNGTSFLKQSFQQPTHHMPSHKKGMSEAFAGIVGASSLTSNSSSALQSATRTPLEIVQLNNSQKQIINSSKQKQSSQQQHSNSLTSSSLDANSFKNYLKSRSKNVTPDGIQQRSNTEASLTGSIKHTHNNSSEHLPDNRARSSTPKNSKQQTPVSNSHLNNPSLTPPKLQLQSPYGLRAPNQSQKNTGQPPSISTAPSSSANGTNSYAQPSPNFFPQKAKAQDLSQNAYSSNANSNIQIAHSTSANLINNSSNHSNSKNNIYGNAGYKSESEQAIKQSNKQTTNSIKQQKSEAEHYNENEKPQTLIKSASKKEEIRQAEIHLNYFGQQKLSNNQQGHSQQQQNVPLNSQQRGSSHNQQQQNPQQISAQQAQALQTQQIQSQDNSRKGSECIPSQQNNSVKQQQQQQQLQQQQQQQLQQQQQQQLSQQQAISQSVIQQYQYKTKAGCNYNGPKTNQDNFIIQTNVNNKPDRTIFSVCDGHGVNGHFCSAFLRKVLPKKIEEALQREINNTEDDFIENSLHLAFLQTSKELLESNIDCTFSGSTCVLLLMIGKKMWSANTGDSRAILCSSTQDYWYANPLSRDHKPDDPEEYQRIISRGGRVETYLDENFNPVGPYRVWLQDENIPGLAMARSFGDVIASQVGVTCEPEVMSFEVGEEDRFIVLASDGVWEFISNEEVMSMLIPSYGENDIDAGCVKVVKESNAAWRRNDDVVDDITCIVVYLKP